MLRHPVYGAVELVTLTPAERSLRLAWASEQGTRVARSARCGNPSRFAATLAASHAIASRPDAIVFRAANTGLLHAVLAVRP